MSAGDIQEFSKAGVSSPLVFSISSGKGGVGKTNISVNLAYCLNKMGYSTLLFDADLGLGNVDVLLGLAPEYNIFHLVSQQASLDQVIYKTEYEFSILPAASGVPELLRLTAGQKLELLEALDPLDERLDFFLVDTGAGINDNVIYFNLAVQHRILVVTPEPTSLTDCYALIKVLNLKHRIRSFYIVVNMCHNIQEAKNTFKRLYLVCDHFLRDISLFFLGFLPKDPEVTKAVVRQKPFCHLYPNSLAGKNLKEIASGLVNLKDKKNEIDGNIKFFWKRLLFEGI